MKLICSSYGIIDPIRPNSGIMHITEAGFKDIIFDMGIYCSPMELENHKIKQRDEHIFSKLKKGKYSLAKSPFLAYDTKLNNINVFLQEITVKSLKYAYSIGCEYLIVQPLFAGIERECLWDVNKEYYLTLMKIAREVSKNGHTVHILLQNLCNNINGHMTRGVCSNPITACKWIDDLNAEAEEEFFGLCMDIGALNLCGQNMHEYIKVLDRRIKAVILRENDGHHNVSLLPFTSAMHGQSQVEWLDVIRGLREIDFDGYLIMEFPDTARAFSPILRPQLMKLAKSIADYFKWQIEIENGLKKYNSIVLFGAGNMCRNYMKCYGEKYPPLFTCDNNRALWGTQFCGLEVKTPKALKEIPKDCAIFICNIYYKEIEKQLREMEIQNPIEFFNDEYMPSFYFNRL